MDSALLGLVLDSSVLIDAERRGLTAADAIEGIQKAVGELPIALSVVTVAELGHGIYRAKDPQIRRHRETFLRDLRSTIPVYPVTEATADVVARTSAQMAARGVNLQFSDLLIGATALELGYAVVTANVRDFHRIPELRLVTL